MRKVFLLLFLVMPGYALTTVTTANKYMIENSSGTDPNGNFCYDFQTRPSCSARITNLALVISSSSLPGGSTQYIQNTATPSTATQIFRVSSGTANTFNSTFSTFTFVTVSTLTPTNIVGTTTNDNAGIGDYGQYVSSTTGAADAPAATIAFGDAAQILLTPGDWDITGMGAVNLNGATVTGAQFAITTTAGNSAAGIISGQNDFQVPIPPTASFDIGMVIPALRASLASNTTYYLKCQVIYTGSPKIAGRISARRVR